MLGPVNLPSHYGGVETHVEELSRALLDIGHEVEIFTATSTRKSIGHVSVKSFIPYFENKDLSGLFSLPLISMKIDRGLDLLHAHIPYCLAGAVIKRISKIPYVFTIHGTGLPHDEISFYEKCRATLANLILRFGTMGSDAIITVSNYTKILVKKYFNAESAVMPNGVNSQLFNPDIDFEGIEEKYNLNADRYILYVGRLVPLKGLDYLLQAAANLVRQFDVQFLIVGSGPEKENLSHLAKRFGLSGCIKMLGKVTQEELLKLYSLSSAFVLPHPKEFFGVVLLEAMSCAKPVIGVDAGGVPEIIKDKENGLLVKPQDPTSLTYAIRFILENQKKARSMGEKGREIVEKEYDWRVVARRISLIYNKVLDNRDWNM